MVQSGEFHCTTVVLFREKALELYNLFTCWIIVEETYFNVPKCKKDQVL
jgi:hypothetical protein